MELMVVGVSKVPSAPLQNRKCVPRKNEELTFKEDFRKIEKRNYLLLLGLEDKMHIKCGQNLDFSQKDCMNRLVL